MKNALSPLRKFGERIFGGGGKHPPKRHRKALYGLFRP